MRISDWSSDVCSSDLMTNYANTVAICRAQQQIVSLATNQHVCRRNPAFKYDLVNTPCCIVKILDRVLPKALAKHVNVVAGSAIQRVVTDTASQYIIAIPADNANIACTTIKCLQPGKTSVRKSMSK